MSAELQPIDPEAPIFSVSVAAELAGMHPQTLRGYDRLGLVVPRRAKGRGRRYSPRDIVKLRLIQRLSQEEGINLNGIQRILELRDELDEVQQRLAQLTELVQELGRVHTHSQRIFTAATSGDIYHGRRRVATMLELPTGPELTLS